MRIGCGCLMGTLLVGAMAGGLGWGLLRMLQRPEIAVSVSTAEDGQRAQEKIYEIVGREGRSGSGSRVPIVLSEAELNAFLARHLGEAADLPISALTVRLEENGLVGVAGLVPLKHLLVETPPRALVDLLPPRWVERHVWLRIRTRVKVERGTSGRRYLRLDVQEFALGRQRLPTMLPRLVLDPATLRLLRWPLPDGIADVTVEKGRALLRPTSSPPRT